MIVIKNMAYNKRKCQPDEEKVEISTRRRHEEPKREFDPVLSIQTGKNPLNLTLPDQFIRLSPEVFHKPEQLTTE